MMGRKNLVAIGPESSDSGVADLTPDDAAIAPLGNHEPAEEMLLTEEFAEETLEETFDEYGEELAQEPEEEPGVGSSLLSGWIAPALAVAAAIAWSAFFAWAHLQELSAPATLGQWSDWIVDWSIPIALIVLLWLLAMRTSRREAGRFADAARALSRESSQLESRLVNVNRELSLARDFIAAQSRDLASLGRVAAERLTQNADHLQNLIRGNGEQVEAIDRVSTRAVENMDRLRDDLPVISNSARDVASQIGQAGNVAKDQLEELVTGFNRLNEFGEASNTQIDALRTRVDEALSAFEQQAAHMEDVSTKRFTELSEKSTEFRTDLDAKEVAAFAAIQRRANTLKEEIEQRGEELSGSEEQALEDLRTRMERLREDGTQLAEQLRDGERTAGEAWSAAITALEEQIVAAAGKVADVDRQAMESARARLEALRTDAESVDKSIADQFSAFEGQLEQRSAQANEREAVALEALEDRLAVFDDQMLDRQEEHLAHVEGIAERGEGLAVRLTELDEQVAKLSAQSEQAEGSLSQAASVLAAKLAESQTIIQESSENISSLTGDSTRLLEIVRSGTKHTSEGLPAAIDEAEKRLTEFNEKAQAISAVIGDARDKGATLADQIGKVQAGGTAALAQFMQLESRLTELSGRSDALAEHAQGELGDAISALETASQNVLSKLGEEQAGAIREMAERIGSESGEAIDSALCEHAAKAIEELQKSAIQAGETGREVTIQLRDQLAIVNELTGNLEQRVTYARERAEEQVDSDFTRRMALITESLNSSAIDISKVFDNEITDTAWSGYLKGDRGIFTRRAVRLLDNQEARSIAEVYQNDEVFRESVSRYIHDFEAMLRSILSTRDGHALAVTLLSSDMGKLYVALAQAIERLRN